MRRRDVPITVAEMAGFRTYAPKFLTPSEIVEFINFIAWNPTAGSIIRKTGGVRKVDWGAGSQGKRGGVRVIYYYQDDTVPIFLLTIYRKSQKVSLTDAEKLAIKNNVKELKSSLKNQGAD